MNETNESESRAWITAELWRALIAMASPYEEQVTLIPRGTCLACELAGDIRHFGEAFLGYEVDLGTEARESLEQLLAWIDRLEESEEWQCWNEQVVRDGPGWQHARELAGSALNELAL